MWRSLSKLAGKMALPLAVLVVGSVLIQGCSLLGMAGSGADAGLSGAPVQPPQLPPGAGPGGVLGYGVQFLVYLAAYAAGSLVKGKVRALKAAAEPEQE